MMAERTPRTGGSLLLVALLLCLGCEGADRFAPGDDVVAPDTAAPAGPDAAGDAVPGADVPAPLPDVPAGAPDAGPPEDVPAPPIDVPAPPADVPAPPIDVPAPPADVPAPPIDVPALPDVPPPVDVPGEDLSTGPPDVPAAGPTVDECLAQALPADVNGPRTTRFTGGGLLVGVVRDVDPDSFGTSGTTVFRARRFALESADARVCRTDDGLSYQISHHNFRDVLLAVDGPVRYQLRFDRDGYDFEYEYSLTAFDAASGATLWGPVALSATGGLP
jgi:hypothetical protein